MLLENKFQKKCTKKFSTKTSSDISQNRAEKKCMPFWHPPFRGGTPSQGGVDAKLSCHFWGGTNGWFDPSKVGYLCTPPVGCPHSRGVDNESL